VSSRIGASVSLREGRAAFAGLVADGRTTSRGAPKNQSSSAPQSGLPARKPRDIAANLGPEPRPPTAVCVGEGVPGAPIQRPLGQPDLGGWLRSARTLGGGYGYSRRGRGVKNHRAAVQRAQPGRHHPGSRAESLPIVTGYSARPRNFGANLGEQARETQIAQVSCRRPLVADSMCVNIRSRT
jgi:hypothetical protein